VGQENRAKRFLEGEALTCYWINFVPAVEETAPDRTKLVCNSFTAEQYKERERERERERSLLTIKDD
jgi:hypothetical protein